MEERIIVHSRAVFLKPKYVLAVLAIICFFVCIYVSKLMYYSELEAYIPTPMKRELTIGADTALSMGKSGWQVGADVARSQMRTVAVWCSGGCRILLVCYLYGLLSSLTVTDQRVYGRDGFGLKINVPLDAISEVRYNGKHGIVLTTSMGTIRIPHLKKAKDVYDAVLIQLWKSRATDCPTG